MKCGHCGGTFIQMDEDDDFKCVLCSRWMENRGKQRKSLLPKAIQKRVDERKQWS